MHHPKGHLKLSGDTHLPDVESDLELERGTTGIGRLAKERLAGGRPGGGVRRAGLLVAPQDDRAARSSATPIVETPLFDATVLASRKIRSPFWKEAHRHPVLKWAGVALGALLVFRLVR